MINKRKQCILKGRIAVAAASTEHFKHGGWSMPVPADRQPWAGPTAMLKRAGRSIIVNGTVTLRRPNSDVMLMASTVVSLVGVGSRITSNTVVTRQTPAMRRKASLTAP